MFSRQSYVIRPRAHLHSAFRGQDEVVTLSIQPAPDNLLGLSACFKRNRYGIHIGRIDKSEARLGSLIHNAKGSFFIALPPKRHCAEANFRDLESSTPESFYFHVILLD